MWLHRTAQPCCSRGLSSMKCWTRVFGATSSLLYARHLPPHPEADPNSDGHGIGQNIDVRHNLLPGLNVLVIHLHDPGLELSYAFKRNWRKPPRRRQVNRGIVMPPLCFARAERSISLSGFLHQTLLWRTSKPKSSRNKSLLFKLACYVAQMASTIGVSNGSGMMFFGTSRSLSLLIR